MTVVVQTDETTEQPELLNNRVGCAAYGPAMVRGVPSTIGIAEEGSLTGPAIGGWNRRQLIFGGSAQRVGARDDDAKLITVLIAIRELLVYQSGVLTGRGKSL